MAFKLLYLEDALADLELIFTWSREKHPGSTEQFATALFNHLEVLADRRTSGDFCNRRFTSITASTEGDKLLKSYISGTVLDSSPEFN